MKNLLRYSSGFLWYFSKLFLLREGALTRGLLSILTVAMAVAAVEAFVDAGDKTSAVIKRIGQVVEGIPSGYISVTTRKELLGDLLSTLPRGVAIVPLTTLVQYATTRQSSTKAPIKVIVTDVSFFLGDEPLASQSAMASSETVERLGRQLALSIEDAQRSTSVSLVPAKSSRLQEGAIYIDWSDAATLLRSYPEVQELLIAAESEALLSDVLGELRVQGIPVTRPAERILAQERLLSAYRHNILLLVVLAGIVAACALYAAMEIGSLELATDLRILSLLGASPLLLGGLFLAYSLFIAFLGLLIGHFLGTPVSLAIERFVLRSTEAYFNLPTSDPFIGSDAALRPIVIGFALLVTVLGSARQIRQVVRLRPSLSAQRDTSPSVMRTTTVVRCAIAASIACVGTLVLAPTAFAAYSLLFLVIILGAAAAPHVLLLLGNALCALRNATVSHIARGQLLGGIGHLRGSVAAVAIAFALMAGLTVMVGSFRWSLRHWLDQSLQAQLYLEPLTSPYFSPVLVKQVRLLPGVAQVLRAREDTVLLNGVNVLVARRDYQSPPPVVAGTWNSSAWLRRDALAISEIAARDLDVGVGDSLRLSGRSMEVMAIVRDYSAQQPLLFVAYERAHSPDEALAPQRLSLVLQAGDRSASKAEIARALNGQPIRVTERMGLTARAFEIFDKTFAVTKVFSWIAALLAGMTLAVTMLQLFLERGREFRLLWTIGVSKGEMLLAIALQGGAVLCAGIATGIVAGAALGTVLVVYVNPLSFGWSLDLHLDGGSLVLGVVQGALMALVPLLAALPLLGRSFATVKREYE